MLFWFAKHYWLPKLDSLGKFSTSLIQDAVFNYSKSILPSAPKQMLQWFATRKKDLLAGKLQDDVVMGTWESEGVEKLNPTSLLKN